MVTVARVYFFIAYVIGACVALDLSTVAVLSLTRGAAFSPLVRTVQALRTCC